MEPQETNNSNTPVAHTGKSKKVGVTIAIVAVLALIGITIAADKKSAEPATAVPADTTSTATATMLPSSAPTAAGTAPASGPSAASTGALYKDGTYTATGSYISPGGADQVGVSVTLKDDIITAATVTPMPGDNTSARYQAMFAANYKQYVVGQDITKLDVHKVSGSSLTSQGFNAAIAQIEAQAKA